MGVVLYCMCGTNAYTTVTVEVEDRPLEGVEEDAAREASAVDTEEGKADDKKATKVKTARKYQLPTNLKLQCKKSILAPLLAWAMGFRTFEEEVLKHEPGHVEVWIEMFLEGLKIFN